MYFLIVRLALGGVFAVAGISKLFDAAGSRKALKEFGVPAVFVPILAVLLPIVEIGIAAAFVFVDLSWFAAVSALGLLVLFTAAMAYQALKGNAPDCHCFGQMHSEPVGITSIVRNLVLIVLASILVYQGRLSQGADLAGRGGDMVTLLLPLIAILLLVAALAFLNKLSEQQRQILRRIEMLEMTGSGGGTVEREDITHPHEGLPIGAVFPDFSLPDLSGAAVSLASIKGSAKPTLFLFVSPNCTPCKALLPEVAKWRAELGDKAAIVLVSSGSKDENIEKLGSEAGPVLLQKEREFAEKLNAQWTPTAVLMDRRGRVASHVAAGDTAIRTLIEAMKAVPVDEDFVHFAGLEGHEHPHKIGKAVPDFALEDINGRAVTSADLKGRQTLAVFWSLTCGFCDAMAGDLLAWDLERTSGDAALLVLSDGDIESNKALGLESPVVIDSERKLSAELGMYGTPSAVLVGEDGRIISEIAIGAPNIWALIGRAV